MVEIPYNYVNSEEIGICGNKEDMSHIYSCENSTENKLKYHLRISTPEMYTNNLKC